MSSAICSLPVSVSQVNKARGEMHVPSRTPLINRAAILHFGPANGPGSLVHMPLICLLAPCSVRKKQAKPERVCASVSHRQHDGRKGYHPAHALTAPQLCHSRSLSPAMFLYTGRLFFRTTALPDNHSHFCSASLVLASRRNGNSLRFHPIFDLPPFTSMVSDCTR